jgi:hypothetical protein
MVKNFSLTGAILTYVLTCSLQIFRMHCCLLSFSVAEPHHLYAAPAPGKIFDAAPAPGKIFDAAPALAPVPAPAPTLLYSKAKFFKTSLSLNTCCSCNSVRFILLKI